MKKLWCAALTLMTMLILAGCGQTAQPEVYTPNPFISLSTLQEDCGRSVAELFPGFTVSETGEGGYRFDMDGREAYLLLDSGQTVLTAVSGDKLADFAIPRMFPTWVDAPVTLRLADVTGDGREELVYLSNYEGTGRSAAYVTVVDLDTLKAVPVDWKTSAANMKSQAVALSRKAREGDYQAVHWSEEDAAIYLEAGFTAPELESWAYLCSVRAPLTFDAKRKTLVASGSYEVIPA